MWSHYNYFIYVIEGRKIWHTAQGSYDLRAGSFVFVRKGACIVEQFFDTRVCFIVFFIPDEFICEVLKSKSKPITRPHHKYDPIIPVDSNDGIKSFFNAMKLYFDSTQEPDKALIEIKFRELILMVADNEINEQARAYFCSLLQEPQSVSLQRVMEDNFHFNLKLEEFAKLSARSLSAFKRDFQKLYNSSPGKWLMEKRLNHSLHLLTNLGKSVGDAAFESGFENVSHFSRAFRTRYGAPPASIKQKALA
jgi:AraC-like DNA-binding protein